MRPHRLALLAGGVLSLLTAATGLALPLVVRALIGDLGNHRAVAAVLLLMTVLVIANAALGAVGSYVLRRTAYAASARPAPCSPVPPDGDRGKE